MTLLNYNSIIPLPAPLAPGAPFQSYTDPNGDVWVAKGTTASGANNGVWRRATDVLYCRYYRSIATNLPLGTTDSPLVFDTSSGDDYGLYNNSTGVWSNLVAGLWEIYLFIAATATATGQSLRCAIVHGIAGSGGAANAVAFSHASGASSVGVNSFIRGRMGVNDTYTFSATCPLGGVQMALLTGYYQNFFMSKYVGAY